MLALLAVMNLGGVLDAVPQGSRAGPPDISSIAVGVSRWPQMLPPIALRGSGCSPVAFCGSLGPSWGHLGAMLSDLGAILGPLGPS